MNKIATALGATVLSILLAACSAQTPATPAPTAASAASGTPGGAAGGQPTGPSVKVGFLAPLSGPQASYGALVKYAPQLVASETNASGGINGSPLEVVTIDTANNPNQAVTALRRLVNDEKAVASVGPYYTGEMQAVVPLAGQLQIPTMAYTSAAAYPGFVEPNQWAFLAGADDAKLTSSALDAYVKKHPEVKTVVLVGDAQSGLTALSIKEIFPKLLQEKNIQILDTVTYQADTTDFSAIVTRLAGVNADGIAAASLMPAAGGLLKELERQGIKKPVVFNGALGTVPIFPSILGTTANGVLSSLNWSPAAANQPGAKDWAAKYQAAVAADGSVPASTITSTLGYGEEPQAYDDFRMLVKALRDAGVNGTTPAAEAREKTRAALMNIKDFPGVLQPKSISPDRRITWDVYALMAQDGQWTDPS